MLANEYHSKDVELFAGGNRAPYKGFQQGRNVIRALFRELSGSGSGVEDELAGEAVAQVLDRQGMNQTADSERPGWIPKLFQR